MTAAGMDSGCGAAAPICDTSGDEPACTACVNDVNGAGQDSGCTVATPICADAECVACSDDATGDGIDSGCDAGEPLCDTSGGARRAVTRLLARTTTVRPRSGERERATLAGSVPRTMEPRDRCRLRRDGAALRRERSRRSVPRAWTTRAAVTLISAAATISPCARSGRGLPTASRARTIDASPASTIAKTAASTSAATASARSATRAAMRRSARTVWTPSAVRATSAART